MYILSYGRKIPVCSGRAPVSRTIGNGLEPRDGQFCLLDIHFTKGESTDWLRLQKKIVERDNYKLKACFTIDVR